MFSPVVLSGVIAGLDALAKLMAPVLTASIALLVWMHRRISAIEDSQQEQEATLYGINGDTLAKGTTTEIRQLREEIRDMNDSLEDKLSDLESRIDSVEGETDDD